MNMSQLEFDSLDEVRSPLVNLATGTGGVYIRAGASLKRPLDQLHNDLTTYYEAAYTPAIKNYDGQFRPIAISATPQRPRRPHTFRLLRHPSWQRHRHSPL